MGKFYGKIGYGVTSETSPGVWTESIEERTYCGELTRNTRKLQNGSNLNDDVIIANDISIIADPFAYENYSSIRYAEIMGTKWKIDSVEVQYPRLILTTGGIYNGEQA